MNIVTSRRQTKPRTTPSIGQYSTTTLSRLSKMRSTPTTEDDKIEQDSTREPPHKQAQKCRREDQSNLQRVQNTNTTIGYNQTVAQRDCSFNPQEKGSGLVCRRTRWTSASASAVPRTTGEKEVINRNLTKFLEITPVEENDQQFSTKVLGHRQHAESSPGMGGTSIRQCQVDRANRRQRHLWITARCRKIRHGGRLKNKDKDAPA